MSSARGNRLAKAFPILALLAFLTGALSVTLLTDVTRPKASERWPEIVQSGKTKHPVVADTFHGDVRFSPLERQAIERAMVDIDRTSCGLVKPTVVWDVRSFTLSALMGHNLIVKTTTEEIVRLRGEKGESNLGTTLNANVKWIFLVADKLGGSMMLWEWVTAHELTHAAGMMDHVPEGLMETEAPFLVLDKPSWQDDDLELFCGVWSCEPRMFRSCRSRGQ